MFCSLCHTQLIKSKVKKQYQTLVEHVSCSTENKEPPFRDVWICPNGLCEFNHFECFFDYYGDFYSNRITGKRMEFIRTSMDFYDKFNFHAITGEEDINEIESDENDKEETSHVWCQTINNSVRISDLIMKDTVTLESRYWKVRKKYNHFLKTKYHNAWHRLHDVKCAHVKISHEYTGDIDPWWLYKSKDRGISFDWVKEPKEPINLEIGQAYYNSSNRLDQTTKRLNIFYDIFKSSLRDRIKTIDKADRQGQQIQILINGRRYWFTSQYDRAGDLCWEKLSFPEDEIKYITLG